jgi:hypothetical protein
VFGPGVRALSRAASVALQPKVMTSDAEAPLELNEYLRVLKTASARVLAATAGKA